MNEQDVSLTDALGILPWEAKDGRGGKGKANVRRGRESREADYSKTPTRGSSP